MSIDISFYSLAYYQRDNISLENSMAEALDLMRGFVCGTISGWAQVFVMQPFEIIKVRLVNQSLFNPEYNGIIHCFQRILKEEGFRSFYKGKPLN